MPSASGMRAVGAWPSDDPYDALVGLLERHIEGNADEVKRSKLRALQSSVAEVGKATVAGLLVGVGQGRPSLLGPEDQSCHLLGGVGLHPGHDVLVGLPRRHRRAVTESLRHDGHVDASR